MHSLGINLLYDTAEISWYKAKAKLQPPEMLLRDWMEPLEQELLFAHDPDTMDAERIQGTIESINRPADLNKWLKNVYA